jgi:hypothetical protein
MARYKKPKSKFARGATFVFNTAKYLAPCKGDEAELPIEDIGVVPQVFQPRPFETDPAHVKQLTDIAAKGIHLEPILVVHVLGRAFLADGHHRLKAARGLKQKKIAVRWHKPKAPVPGKKGLHAWLLSVVAETAAENTHAKLPMNHQERREYAWRLTVADYESQPLERQGSDWTFSRSDLAARTGVGQRTISRMRAILKEKGDTVVEARWWEVAYGNWKGNDDDGEAFQQMIREAAEKVRACIPQTGHARGPLILQILDEAFPFLNIVEREEDEGDEWPAQAGGEQANSAGD